LPTKVLVGLLSRRTWVQRSGVGIAALLLAPPLLAEEQPLDAAIRSMATVTGTNLSDPWLHPTAELVAVILADSQPLRALDLGSIEPATYFKAD
jgi:hypothetical protein